MDGPAVIVINDVMINGDGLECTRQLKSDPATRDMLIIMASSSSTQADIVAGLEAGVDEYLTTPLRSVWQRTSSATDPDALSRAPSSVVRNHTTS
jgi:PleD family two-component response regulator